MTNEDTKEVYKIARMIAKEEIAIALKAKVAELQDAPEILPELKPEPLPTPIKK